MAAISNDLTEEFPYLWQAKAVGWASEEMIREHVRLSVKRKLRPFFGLPFEREETAVIVGSAPSYTKYLDEIAQKQKAGATVYAVNQTHDWLIEAGIVPDYFVAIDPCDGWTGIVTPHEGVTYLLASICNPELFDICPPDQTMIWHGWHDDWVEDELKKLGLEMLIVYGGGTASMRCMHIAYLSGFRKMHLYGVDSSFSVRGDVYAHPMRYKNPHKQTKIDVLCGGKVFHTQRAFVAQVEDFRKLFDLFGGSCEIEVFGDGLLPHAAKVMNESKRRQMGLLPRNTHAGE